MNDNLSASAYRARWLAGPLVTAAKTNPVLVLTGARQVGKSTLLRHEEPFKDWTYITLDDFDVLEQAEKQPRALWAGTDRLIIDEVQKAPKILSAIKMEVDNNRGKNRFLLSGSANLLMMQTVSESLAGRALYLTLMPMTVGEEKFQAPPRWLLDIFSGTYPEPKKLKNSENVEPYLLRGLMPPLFALTERDDQLRWWQGYVATYLERDLRQLSQVDSLVDFRRVMELTALRSGQLANQTEISRDVGVSQATVHRYLNLLEATSVLERVSAYSVSKSKRLIKSPKPYFADPGLAAFLTGHYDTDGFRASRESGALFETFCYLHLRALIQLMVPVPRLYYWRTTTGHEVDFVIEHGQKLLAIEVKLTTPPGFADIRNIELFLAEYPKAVGGVLIHTGTETKYLGDRIIAMPWTAMAGL